jgi:hypothetical protein
MMASGLLLTDSEPNAPPSNKRWALVSQWLGVCEREHQSCARVRRATSAAPWHPTRLIDLWVPTAPDGLKRYRLIETATTQPVGNGRYATLSHVWGSAPQDQQPAYRTLSRNYRARLTAGILRSELPRCFVDAIDVAWRLRCRYLWIDSLCIIQDSQADWAAEAGRMADVYRNSWCNLSATACSSSRDKFPALDEHLHEPRFVGTAWSGQYRGLYQIFDPLFWQERVTSTRLASRGWVFQERALAPRVLHFGLDQVLWECAESEACEEFPLGIPRRFISSGSRGFKWKFNALENPGPEDAGAADASQQLHAVWTAALDSYTRCELTHATDKLVAISGVARVLADRFRDQYRAGLWQSNLVGGLCWRVDRIRRATQQLVPVGTYARRWDTSRRYSPPAPYLAPSWSWASVDGCVVPCPYLSSEERSPSSDESRLESTRSLVVVLAVSVEAETSDNPFGAVKPGAEMRVQGTMYPLVATQDPLVRSISVRYAADAASTEAINVQLDQPESVEVLGTAWFLPLLCVDQTADEAKESVEEVVNSPQFGGQDPPMSGATSSSSTQKGRELEHEPITPGAGASTGSAAGGNRDAEANSTMGLIVVPTEDGKSYRRVGFHECPAHVVEALGRPENCWVKGEFVLV